MIKKVLFLLLSGSLICLFLFSEFATYGEDEKPPSRLRWPTAGPEAKPLQDVVFTTSSAPDKEVLVFESRGSYYPGLSRTIIYGDGKVQLTKMNRDGKILESYSTDIDQNELRSLVQIAVENGLMERSGEELEAERQKLGPRSTITDAATTVITISLDSYSRGGQSQQTVKNTIGSYAAAFYADQYSEILQYKGFYLLHKEIYKLWQRSRDLNR